MHQIYHALVTKTKFEISKDEHGEVRVRSNAVMEVRLGISIPIFS